MPENAENESGPLDETRTSLERIQGFDVDGLIQRQRLGSDLNFEDVVEPAQRIVDLFKRLSVSALQDLPDDALGRIREQANQVYNLFSQITDFDTSQANPRDARNNLVNKVAAQYGPCFNALHPYISYSLHRSADFQRLDQEARATIQGIKDDVAEAVGKIEKAQTEAQTALAGVKEAAAESGVTQQAIHFGRAAEEHQAEAVTWETRTRLSAAGLGAVAIASLFFHRIPVLTPENTREAIQLALGKILIFATLSYVLYLSAKNFLSHKHNAIVNRHRQNALLTFKALAEAAHLRENRDLVLTYAAACIFGPQATGYANESGEAVSRPGNSLVGLMTRSISEDG